MIKKLIIVVGLSVCCSLSAYGSQSIKHQSVKHQSIKHQSVKHQSVKHQSVKHQSVNNGARLVDVNHRVSPPEIEASAWVLMEVNSGWVVTHHHAEKQLPPASITKLMTNYVVYQKLDDQSIGLKDQVSISEKAWRAEGSRMFAKVDSRIELNHLLKSTIIQSGNDAAIALAEHIAGSESAFAQMMNTAASKLGLENSHFKNSTGLPDPEHFMSANDIATLAAAIIREFPDFYRWYAEKVYTHNDITQYNRNKLLWRDSTVDGLKTGHTNAAGYCLVGSALRNGERWIAVVLGSENEKMRERDILKLLDYGFNNYQAVQMLGEQGGIATAEVYQGEVDEVRLQAINPVNVVVPRGREKDIQVEIKVSPYYIAPVDIGQPVGVATLSLDGKLLTDVPLVAMSSIKEGGLWKRLKDAVRLRLR